MIGPAAGPQGTKTGPGETLPDATSSRTEEDEIPMRVLSITTAAAAAVALLLLSAAPDATAQPRTSRVETEGKLVSFDDTANTIVVDVDKTGRPPGDLADVVKRGREATFKVKPTGSVLTRTTVKVNGRRAELAEVPMGKTVKITWKPDKDDPSMPFAWTIDTILTEEEMEERYEMD